MKETPVVKKTISANSLSQFFEDYNALIKTGYRPPDAAMFDMQFTRGYEARYWTVDMEFSAQPYIDAGISQLAWEDLKALAKGIGVKVTSKQVTIKAVKKHLGLETGKKDGA